MVHRMRIGYLIPGCGVSGGIHVICQHANRLKRRGHDVLLISMGKKDEVIDWFPHQNVPIIWLDDCPGDLDILVATSWRTSFWVAALPARNKCYFVQSDETRFHPEGSMWEHITRLSYMMDFNFLTEAKWIKDWLKKEFNKDAFLVPNGLDSELFRPAKPLEPKIKKPRILLEGAIGLPYKGMKEAFEAVSDLDVEVWCVSSFGEPQPEWKCDRFFQQVPITQMKHIYSSCDILLKLSRVEGFFGPPLEMMACGGTCVVGKVTGSDEYIVPDVNALVVDPMDIDGARDALKLIISDKDFKSKLIANGLQTAKEWQWEPSIDVLEKNLADISGYLHNEGQPQNKNNRSIASFYFSLLDDKKMLTFLNGDEAVKNTAVYTKQLKRLKKKREPLTKFEVIRSFISLYLFKKTGLTYMEKAFRENFLKPVKNYARKFYGKGKHSHSGL